MALYMDARNDTVAVGTSTVMISPARPRSEIVITNTSTAAQKITLSFGTPSAAGAGVVLTPYSVYFASNTTGFQTWTGEIFAIGDGAAGALSIFER